MNLIRNKYSLLPTRLILGCDYVTCISLTPEANLLASTPASRQLHLRHLDMTDCVNVDDAGLQIIVTYCSRLVSLYLRRCARVTDIGVQYVAAFCPALRELSVGDCRRVSDVGVVEVAARLKAGLRYLSVARCPAVTDAGLAAIAERCPRLRYVNARGCPAVGDDGVGRLAVGCTRVRSVDVGKTAVTDRGLYAIARCCARLGKLSVRGCDGVTDRGVVEVARRCGAHLRQLNVQECDGVGPEAYRVVRQLAAYCHVEHSIPGFY